MGWNSLLLAGDAASEDICAELEYRRAPSNTIMDLVRDCPLVAMTPPIYRLRPDGETFDSGLILETHEYHSRGRLGARIARGELQILWSFA